MHYNLQIPAGLAEPVTVTAKLQYRKFDQQYMDFVTRSSHPGDNPIPGYVPGKPYQNTLPVTTLAVDQVTFPILAAGPRPAGSPAADPGHDSFQASFKRPEIPAWQRWNDYGIGLLLEGQGKAKGELRQAAEAFAQVEKLNRFDGPLNLARVHYLDGSNLNDAVAALGRLWPRTIRRPRVGRSLGSAGW